ncbi:MAG: 5-aminolevulinate synthase [Rhodobacter sp.]|nr:5-aminolevulinate synthase [Rhodobacter sp.]
MAALASKPLLLLIICGFAYALATLAMKALSHSPTIFALGAVALCLAGAVLLEVIVLQRMELGTAYIAIIATESLIVVSIAAFIGEGLGPKELAGAALVLMGTALIGT